MTPATRPSPASVVRGRTTGATQTEHTGTQARGLTNARTRIVGYRQGVLADAIVALVRFGRTASSGVAGWTARVTAVVTPLGWAMLIISPVGLVVGYRFGWTELAAVGYAGAVLIVIAGVYLIGRNAFTLGLELPQRRVVIGAEAVGAVTVMNPTRRRILGVKVEIPVGRGLAELVLPSVGKGTSFRQEFSVPTSRRGVYPVGPIRTVRADPVGLVRRELVWTEVAELVVHPRTIAIASTSTGLIRDLEGSATRDLTNSDVAFHALREYVPGDERRYIHWKSTAKTGTYMVRQFEETRRSHLVVALSLAAADYAAEEEFELAVSVAGSLGVRAIRDVRNVSVVTSVNTPEFAKRKTLAVKQLNTLTRVRLLDDLAVVEQSDSALTLPDVAKVTAEQISGISVAFLVCGSLPAPGQLRSASAQFPAGVEVIAVVCDPEMVPGLRQVSGLSVLTIGYLEDLQKSLAKAAAV